MLEQLGDKIGVQLLVEDPQHVAVELGGHPAPSS